MNADPRINITRTHAPHPPQRPAGPDKRDILLLIEGEARAVKDRKALLHFMCNETARLVSSNRICFLAPGAGRGLWRMEAASSVSGIDRNAPAVRAWERSVSEVTKAAGTGRQEVPESPVIAVARSLLPPDERGKHAVLVCLSGHDGRIDGQLLLIRDNAFTESDTVLLARLAGAYGHALSFFTRRQRMARLKARSRQLALGGAMLAALAMFIPVPMSVLAPVEVVARDPLVITSRLDGVISAVLVEPGAVVAEGAELVRFEDTELISRIDIAARNKGVAEARYRRVQQGASQSSDMRRELAVTAAELALADAELAEAQALHARTVLRSPGDGIALFSSRDEWTGRPVATGERIMEIGDPSSVELRIDLALGDSIALGDDAAVRVFLDNDPLTAIDATIAQAGYRAEAVDGNRLAYPVIALPQAAAPDGLRIGARGTARISGGKVSLGFYLFRRPLSQLRQWAGI